MGLDGAQLRYGVIKGWETAVKISVPIGASEVFPAGGAFVKNDGSGRMEVAGDGTALLAGFCIAEDDLDAGQSYSTASSTEGATKGLWIPYYAMGSVVVRLPVTGGTYVATMVGQTCDIEVVSNVQGAQLDASAEDTVIIVGGDLVNNDWVDLMLNDVKITGLTGVA